MDVLADLHDLEFVWPHTGPTNVVVTGTFDQWSSSIRLAKGDVGFSGTVKIPWGEKVAYKFIVDGYWLCRDDRPQEDDGHGNINNFLRVPVKPAPLPTQEPPVVHAEEDAHLTIPSSDDAPAEGEGYSDVETMVTAPESVRAIESVASESLSLPKSADDPEKLLLGAAANVVPVAGTTTQCVTNVIAASDLQLDITSPIPPVTSATSVDISSQREKSASSPDVVPRLPIPILPVNDSTIIGSASQSPNHQDQIDSSASTHAPVQFSKIRSGASALPAAVPMAAKEQTLARVQSAAAKPSPPDVAEAVPTPAKAVVADVTIVAPTPVVAVAPETLVKKAAIVPPETTTSTPETATSSPKRNVSVPTSSDRSSTLATPSSRFSTASHKKRRSLFAKIKDIFDRAKSKERK
ncbi:carbohydrate-binding module family 48 protein [Paxillus involutus ATCC 200175]|nr:carbohydrate-binding module family 48 protein [Paxillus involutus ATCC 200175]